ncbi:MAG TPA: sigma-70 family RNA polymerase sigma factor [Chloroflexota bacterium]|nr:sigma-70 family RNA polymerase sigma factor [Chloroflexota bacterium]
MAELGEPDKQADAQLLADVAGKRDPDALAKLYDQYGGVAFGLSLRMVNDPGAAEEVVQEAFFNVWRNAPSYNDERGSVRNWILSIVHNQAIDRGRRLRSKQRLDSQLELAEDTLQRPDVWGEVSAALDRQRITQALSALPQEQRATIELAYFGGYSHSEIANLLRIPLGTVKGRLRLGMDKLRAALVEAGLEFSPE